MRINLAGGWYHVTARGNNRQAIYEDIANVVCIVALILSILIGNISKIV